MYVAWEYFEIQQQYFYEKNYYLYNFTSMNLCKYVKKVNIFTFIHF